VKNYNTPQLTVHGNVEAITQAFGSKTTADMVFIGASNVDGPIASGGSATDGIIVPK
jgi:hypothetical protein